MELERNARFVAAPETPSVQPNQWHSSRPSMTLNQATPIRPIEGNRYANHQADESTDASSFGIQLRSMMQNPSKSQTSEEQLQQAIEEISKLDQQHPTQQQHQMVDYNEESELDLDPNLVDSSESPKSHNITDSSSSSMMMENPSQQQKLDQNRASSSKAITNETNRSTAKQNERQPSAATKKPTEATKVAKTQQAISAPTSTQNPIETTTRGLVPIMMREPKKNELVSMNGGDEARTEAPVMSTTKSVSASNQEDRLNLENGRPAGVMRNQSSIARPKVKPNQVKSTTELTLEVQQTTAAPTTTSTIPPAIKSSTQAFDLTRKQSSSTTKAPQMSFKDSIKLEALTTMKSTSSSLNSMSSSTASPKENEGEEESDDATDMPEGGSGNRTDTSGADESDSEGDDEDSSEATTENSMESTTTAPMRMVSLDQVSKSSLTTPPTLLTTIDIERLSPKDSTTKSSDSSKDITQSPLSNVMSTTVETAIMDSREREREESPKLIEVAGDRSTSPSSMSPQTTTKIIGEGTDAAITMPMDALMRMVMMNQFDNQKTSSVGESPTTTTSTTTQSSRPQSVSGREESTQAAVTPSQAAQSSTQSPQTVSSRMPTSSESQSTSTASMKPQQLMTTEVLPIEMRVTPMPSSGQSEADSGSSQFSMMTTQSLDKVAQKAVSMVLDSLRGSTSSEPTEEEGREPKIELLNMDLMPIQRMSKRPTQQEEDQMKTSLLQQIQQIAHQTMAVNVEPGMRLRPLMQSIPNQGVKTSQQPARSQSISPSVLSNDQVYMIMMPAQSSKPITMSDAHSKKPTGSEGASQTMKTNVMSTRPQSPAMMTNVPAVTDGSSRRQESTKPVPQWATMPSPTAVSEAGPIGNEKQSMMTSPTSGSTMGSKSGRLMATVKSAGSTSTPMASVTTTSATAAPTTSTPQLSSSTQQTGSTPATLMDQMRMTQRELSAMRAGKQTASAPSTKTATTLTTQSASSISDSNGSSQRQQQTTPMISGSSNKATNSTPTSIGEDSRFIITTPANSVQGKQASRVTEEEASQAKQANQGDQGSSQVPLTIPKTKSAEENQRISDKQDNGSNDGSLTVATSKPSESHSGKQQHQKESLERQNESSGRANPARPSDPAILERPLSKEALSMPTMQQHQTQNSQNQSQIATKSKINSKSKTNVRPNANNSASPSNQLSRLRANGSKSEPEQTASAIRQFGGANRMSALANKPVPFGRPATMVMTLALPMQQSQKLTLRQQYEQPTYDYGPSIAVRRPDEPLANGQVPNCTLSGKNFCVLTQDYPMDEVRRAVEQSFRSVRIMYEELQTVSDQELHKDDYINKTNNQAASGKFACQTQVEMMRPGWAKDEITKEWMLVVNTDVFPQRVRTESCAQANTPCEFIAPFYDSTCQQRYSLHRMIAIDPHDPSRSPQVAVFKFPAGCVCRVHPIRKTSPFSYPTTTPIPQVSNSQSPSNSSAVSKN